MRKTITMILVGVILMSLATNVFAIDPSDLINNATQISPDDYNNAQSNPENKNNTNTNNNVANTNNNTNNSSLPQTGIEDSGMGMLLIICVASAIFAYRKISDYRNI